MAEYIEREYVLKCMEDSYKNAGISAEAKAKMTRWLNKAPAADVRPVVRGKWYGEADGYADGELVYDMWSCPICGKRFEEWEEKPDWNFCPNCGADMRPTQMSGANREEN